MQFNRSLGPLTVKGDVRAVLAGVVLLGLLSNLGFWQLGRAGEKAVLEDRWQARAAEPAVTPRALIDRAIDPADRQVRWEGEFRAGDYLLLDNRLHRGQPGFHLIALASAGDAVVPVNLGWLAGDPSRRTIPEPALPEGLVTIEGRVYVPSGKPLMMQKPEPPEGLPAAVQTLYWDGWQGSLSRLTGAEVFPYEVRIQPNSPLALVAEWTVVNQSPSMHLGYAVQWFAMAAVLLLIGVLRLTNVRSLLSGRA